MDQPLIAPCRWLRWKGRERDASADAPSRGAIDSCLRTGRPWGPDGAPAAPEICRGDRACYAAPIRTTT